MSVAGGQVPHVPIQPEVVTGPTAALASIRRVPTQDLTVEERRRALVRYLAADPEREQWLRDHVALHLERAAAGVPAADTGLEARASLVEWAAAHRAGVTPLW